DAQSCDRCDWTRSATETAEGKASDAIAVIFSIIPGLGHIYKGHILAGFLWMAGAIPVGIFVLLAAFASAGWGLGLFFFYLGAVMLHAYGIKDRVVPPKEDQGEEYLFRCRSSSLGTPERPRIHHQPGASPQDS